jgi:hypothetical protein
MYRGNILCVGDWGKIVLLEPWENRFLSIELQMRIFATSDLHADFIDNWSIIRQNL